MTTPPNAPSSPDTELLIDRAHQALLDNLRSGTLHSGASLSIPMLVEHLSLPIAAVRDAVKRAEAAGLVTVQPKRGITIMQASAEITRDCLDLRAMFECEGARILIETGGDIGLDDLRRQHEALRDQAADRFTPDLPRRAIMTDLSLHDALAGCLSSPLARRLYAENRDRIAVIQNTRPFLADRIASAMEEHLRIITALEARDLDETRAAIHAHLRHTLRWWGIAS